MEIGVDELRSKVAQALMKNGVPRDEAVVGAEMCVDAELRQHRSHGVRLLRNVTAEYSHGADRRGELALMDETPVSARLDGGFHLSLFVHREAADLAAEKARTSGIGLVSVANAGVSGALGYLAERMATAGLVGIVANSSPVTVVAPGGHVPMLGTNPLGIAIPRLANAPLVLDMATSSIAFNEVLRRRAKGEDLPVNAANDNTGQPTTDSAAAIDPVSGRGRILPFGGHRGFGLSLMLELMVSAGVTGRVADDKRGAIVLEPSDFSGLYLAYQPGLVGSPQAAAEAVERLIEGLVSQGARMPGENSRALREEALAKGTVELDDEAAGVLSGLLGGAIT